MFSQECHKGQCLDLSSSYFTYVNDLPTNISSTIRLYSDDLILYREINAADDFFLL